MTKYFSCAVLIVVLGACAKTPSAETKDTSKTEPAKAAVPVQPAKTDHAGANTTTCKSGEDTRTLVVTARGKGCEVSYGKFSNSSVVATARNGMEHCEEVAVRIQKKLEGAGYTCK